MSQKSGSSSCSECSPVKHNGQTTLVCGNPRVLVERYKFECSPSAVHHAPDLSSKNKPKTKVTKTKHEAEQTDSSTKKKGKGTIKLTKSSSNLRDVLLKPQTDLNETDDFVLSNECPVQKRAKNERSVRVSKKNKHTSAGLQSKPNLQTSEVDSLIQLPCTEALTCGYETTHRYGHGLSENNMIKDDRKMTADDECPDNLINTNELEDRCVICEEVINDGRIAQHQLTCLKQQFSRGKKSNEKKKGNAVGKPTIPIELVLCQICQQDLSHLSTYRRTQHVNHCIDQQDPKSEPVPMIKQKLREISPQIVLPCPICGKILKTQIARTKHIKQCSKNYRVESDQLENLIHVQKEEFLQKAQSGGLPAELKRGGPKPAKGRAANKMKQNQVITVDKDTQVAMALSSSMMEEEKKQEAVLLRRLESVDRIALGYKKCDKDLKKGRKKKRVASSPEKIPPLLQQTTEQIRKRIADKVSKIITLEDDLPVDSSPPALPISTVVNMFTSSPRKAALEESKSLWKRSSLKVEEALQGLFYVDTLSEHITVCEKKEVCVLGNQSTVQHSKHPPQNESRAEDDTVHLMSTQTALVLAELAGDTSITTDIPSQTNQINLDTSSHCDMLSEEMIQDDSTKPNDQLASSGFCPDLENIKGSKTVMLESLQNDLSVMVDNPLFSDVSLLTKEGKKIHGHKMILAARCPNITQVLKSGSELVLKKFSYSGVLSVMNFIYTGELPENEHREELIYLSDRLGLSELSAYLHEQEESVMSENVEVERGSNLFEREENIDELITSLLSSSSDSEEDVKTETETDEEEMENLYEFMLTQREKNSRTNVDNSPHKNSPIKDDNSPEKSFITKVDNSPEKSFITEVDNSPEKCSIDKVHNTPKHSSSTMSENSIGKSPIMEVDKYPEKVFVSNVDNSPVLNTLSDNDLKEDSEMEILSSGKTLDDDAELSSQSVLLNVKDAELNEITQSHSAEDDEIQIKVRQKNRKRSLSESSDDNYCRDIDKRKCARPSNEDGSNDSIYIDTGHTSFEQVHTMLNELSPQNTKMYPTSPPLVETELIDLKDVTENTEQATLAKCKDYDLLKKINSGTFMNTASGTILCHTNDQSYILSPVGKVNISNQTAFKNCFVNKSCDDLVEDIINESVKDEQTANTSDSWIIPDTPAKNPSFTSAKSFLFADKFNASSKSLHNKSVTLRGKSVVRRKVTEMDTDEVHTDQTFINNISHPSFSNAIVSTPVCPEKHLPANKSTNSEQSNSSSNESIHLELQNTEELSDNGDIEEVLTNNKDKTIPQRRTRGKSCTKVTNISCDELADDQREKLLKDVDRFFGSPPASRINVISKLRGSPLPCVTHQSDGHGEQDELPEVTSPVKSFLIEADIHHSENEIEVTECRNYSPPKKEKKTNKKYTFRKLKSKPLKFGPCVQDDGEIVIVSSQCSPSKKKSSPQLQNGISDKDPEHIHSSHNGISDSEDTIQCPAMSYLDNPTTLQNFISDSQPISPTSTLNISDTEPNSPISAQNMVSDTEPNSPISVQNVISDTEPTSPISVQNVISDTEPTSPISVQNVISDTEPTSPKCQNSLSLKRDYSGQSPPSFSPTVSPNRLSQTRSVDPPEHQSPLQSDKEVIQSDLEQEVDVWEGFDDVGMEFHPDPLLPSPHQNTVCLSDGEKSNGADSAITYSLARNPQPPGALLGNTPKGRNTCPSNSPHLDSPLEEMNYLEQFSDWNTSSHGQQDDVSIALQSKQSLPSNKKKDKSEIYKTPQCARPAKRGKKKWVPPSPFTPMPPYNNMDTPKLKNEIKKFGIKPVSKKRMVVCLTDIYHQTHQYETDTEAEVSLIEDTTSISTEKIKTKNQIKPSKSKSIEALIKSKSTKDKYSEKGVYLDGSDLIDISQEEEGTDGEEGTSGSDMLEESFMVDSKLPQSSQQECNPNLQHELGRFFTGNPALYCRVLTYEPLELDWIKEEVKKAGIKCSMDKLIKYLDEKCIMFTMKSRTNRQRTRKKKTKKSAAVNKT